MATSLTGGVMTIHTITEGIMITVTTAATGIITALIVTTGTEDPTGVSTTEVMITAITAGLTGHRKMIAVGAAIQMTSG